MREPLSVKLGITVESVLTDREINNAWLSIQHDDAFSNHINQRVVTKGVHVALFNAVKQLHIRNNTLERLRVLAVFATTAAVARVNAVQNRFGGVHESDSSAALARVKSESDLFTFPPFRRRLG